MQRRFLLECDRELVEGESGEHEGIMYHLFHCHRCHREEWNPVGSVPEGCLYETTKL